MEPLLLAATGSADRAWPKRGLVEHVIQDAVAAHLHQTAPEVQILGIEKLLPVATAPLVGAAADHDGAVVGGAGETIPQLLRLDPHLRKDGALRGEITHGARTETCRWILLEACHLPLKSPRKGTVTGILAGDELAPGPVAPLDQGGGEATSPAVQHDHTRIAGGEPIEQGSTAIGGAVVHHHELQIHSLLGGDRIKRCLQGVATVAHPHHHRHQRIRHLTGPPPCAHGGRSGEATPRSAPPASSRSTKRCVGRSGYRCCGRRPRGPGREPSR